MINKKANELNKLKTLYVTKINENKNDLTQTRAVRFCL